MSDGYSEAPGPERIYEFLSPLLNEVVGWIEREGLRVSIVIDPDLPDVPRMSLDLSADMIDEVCDALRQAATS